MSPRQLSRLALVLGALLLLWGAASLARRGAGGPTESDRFALPTIPRDSMDSIIILRPSDTARLARVDSTTWTVNGHRASPTAVQELLAALGDTARSTELAGGRSRGVDRPAARRARACPAAPRPRSALY